MNAFKRVVNMASRQAGKCVCGDTLVKIRNKQTGEVQTISIGVLYDIIKNDRKSKQD